MLKAFINCWKIAELRRKILMTLGLLVICRVIANVPCPGVDYKALAEVMGQLSKNSGGTNDVLNLFDMFSGGALQKFAVGTLGIMPYITASIIVQLMTPIFPQLERLKREGESGYQKINQFTRYLTLGICLVQGFIAALAMENPARIGLSVDRPVVFFSGWGFIFMTVVVLTCGTLVLMWLGEQITEHGIGQGASLIITIGIIDRLPQAVRAVHGLVLGNGDGTSTFGAVHVAILIALFFAVVAATVALTVAVRKVPIQYARMMAGRPSGPTQTSFFPLAVNYANVMPIIFSSALMMFPPMLLNYLAQHNQGWAGTVSSYLNYGTTSYMILEGSLILLFSFFWVSSQFNPIQIADDLKRQGAYIPGVRPGPPTAEFLDWSMTRITTFGALFLCVLALLPMVFYKNLDVPQMVAQFFGGTSLLIIVGVLLNTMRQVESMLMMHGYDSFMQQGRLRSRGGRTDI